MVPKNAWVTLCWIADCLDSPTTKFSPTTPAMKWEDRPWRIDVAGCWEQFRTLATESQETKHGSRSSIHPISKREYGKRNFLRWTCFGHAVACTTFRYQYPARKGPGVKIERFSFPRLLQKGFDWMEGRQSWTISMTMEVQLLIITLRSLNACN